MPFRPNHFIHMQVFQSIAILRILNLNSPTNRQTRNLFLFKRIATKSNFNRVDLHTDFFFPFRSNTENITTNKSIMRRRRKKNVKFMEAIQLEMRWENCINSSTLNSYVHHYNILNLKYLLYLDLRYYVDIISVHRYRNVHLNWFSVGLIYMEVQCKNRYTVIV